MGRQVWFKTLLPDLLLLEAELHRRNVAILPYYHPSPKPRRVLTIDPRTVAEPKVYVTIPRLLPQISAKEIVEQGYFLISTEAPVAELLRGANEAHPARGRWYYETGRFIGSAWVPFDAEFLDMADSMARWIRRTFRYDKASGAYLGPAAFEASSQPDLG